MLIYTLLLFVILFIGILGIYSRMPKFALTIIMIILFLFYALRYEVGLDYLIYYNLILNHTNSLFPEEPLNNVLIQIDYWLEFNQFYFIATAFIFLYPLYKMWYKESKDILLSILLFMSTDCLFGQSFSFVRQFAAIGLFILAVPYLYEKKYIKYYLLCTVAILFHKSAFIIFVLPFFRKLLYKKMLPYWMFFGGILIFLLYPLILDNLYPLLSFLVPTKYMVYFNPLSGKFTEGMKMYVLWCFLTFISLLVYYLKKTEQTYDNKELFYINVFFFGFFIYSIALRVGFSPGTRISYYMLIFYTIAIPFILNRCKYKRGFKILFIFLSILFYFTSIWFVSQKFEGIIIPYKTIFNQE
ncbi:MAG: EpsG family protein [Chitinophagaceae bacterium]